VNFSVVYPSRRDITMKKLHRRVLADMVGDEVGDVEEEKEEEDMGGVRNLGRDEKRRPGRQAGS
jgi:hypothetical protein